MATLTVTQAACHIPEIWSADTIDAVEASIVIADQVQRKWEKSLTVGDILNIGYISNPTVASKGADTNITLEAIGPSSAEASQTITVGTHQYVAWGLENITDVQSQTDLMAKYTGKAGYALGGAIDINLAALATSFSQGVGTLGIELTYDNLLRAWQYLEDARAPTADRFIILRPGAVAGLLKLDEMKSSDYTGPSTAGQAVKEAYIGRILGANTYSSTLATVPGTNDCEGWFCHKDGVAIIVQDVRSKTQFDIHMDADVFLSTVIYGYAEVLIPPVTAGGAAATDAFDVQLKTIS